MTILVAGALLPDERITPNKIVGVMIGFVGVALVIGGSGLVNFGQNITAQLAVIGAALSYAFAGVYGRRFRAMSVGPVATATGQVTASSVIMVPLVVFFDWPIAFDAPTALTWAAILGLGLLSTAMPYILYFRLLARAGATNLLLVTFLIPVCATLLGVAVLRESLWPVDYMGMALIGIGLVTVDSRLLVKRRCEF